MKKIKFAASFLVLILLLSACGGGTGTSTAGTNPAPAGANPAPADASLADSTATAPVRNVHLAFGGNNSSTSSYVIAVCYGEIINAYVPGVTMTVEETGGGYEVLGQLIAGELDGCTSSSVASSEAASGTGQFEGVANHDGFRTWMPLYISPIQAVVKADSSIQSYRDFAGKRIGIDLVGTGSEQTFRRMFDALGVSPSATLLNISKDDAMEMLKTGELDISMISTAAPTTVIVEFGTTEKFRIVDFTEEERQVCKDIMDYLADYDMPAGTYDQLTKDVNTMGNYTNAYLSKDLDEDVVYDMTKAVWEHFDRVRSSHPSQELVTPEMLKDLQRAVDFHPGALRYYKEMGWL